MFKRRQKNQDTIAHIISSEGGKIVVELEDGLAKYKKGQSVVATVSFEGKTDRGRKASVSDIVAQGKIEEVVGKRLTICSPKRNPFVSQRAAIEAKNNSREVKVRTIQ